MGCVASKEATDNGPVTSSVGGTHFPNFTKPRAFLVKPAPTVSELAAKREEFWHTSPSYGGAREIWDVLKAAADAQDIETARLFVESADHRRPAGHVRVLRRARGTIRDSKVGHGGPVQPATRPAGHPKKRRRRPKTPSEETRRSTLPGHHSHRRVKEREREREKRERERERERRPERRRAKMGSNGSERDARSE